MQATTVSPEPRASSKLLAAVLLLAASGLMFELTLTRIFSATIWYHYTFVAISVALFGWGLGGFLVYVLRLARFRAQVTRILIGLSILLAAALPLFPYGILQFPFTPERLNFYFLLSVLPFLVGGAALSLAFEAHGNDANRLYFADLSGAALGVLLVPFAIGQLGAETTVLATAILPALAAVFLALSLPKPRSPVWAAGGLVAVIGTVGVAAWNFKTDALAIRDAPSKGLYQLLHANPQVKIETDRWNAYSRITSVSSFDEHHMGRLYIDSDAWTNVLKWDGTPDVPPGARNWFRAFPFRLVNEPKVMVIGPGGGTDVIMAVCAGSPSVTAVEMNPLIVACVRRLGDKVGNLYDHPKVHLVQQEGRNFIERTGEKFDFIVLGFVDSWAAVASGGLSLTENYLYTREAIEAYYDHLTDNGALVIIRWPVDVRRLVANSVAMLRDKGMSIEDIGKRILAAVERAPNPAQPNEPLETVFMLSRSPLPAEKIDALLAGHDKAHIIYAPGKPSDPPYAKLLSGQSTLEQFGQSFETLATPVSDERPFYFATEKPWGMPSFVVDLFKIPALAVLGFVALLLVAGKLLGFQTPGPRAFAYFGALGVGFIICEIALLQRLILLLGHPIYTFVVLLFTLLVAGSLGSLFARRLPPERIRSSLAWIIAGVIALVLLAAFALPPLVRLALPLDLWPRVLVAAVLVFPFGFLMGMPFPLALRRNAQDPRGAPVSALWGINGVASVVGSMTGVLLAVAAGFTAVFLAGAGCYVVALLARPK